MKRNSSKIVFWIWILLGVITWFIFAFVVPQKLHAQTTVPQGGTGLSAVPAYGLLVGNSALRLSATTSPTVGVIIATSTSATSSLPRLRVSNALEFGGLYIANLNNFSAANFNATSSATSTFTCGIATNLLSVTSTTASSTFGNGINLTHGCFSINNVCLSTGGGSGGVSSGLAGQLAWYAADGSNVSGTSTGQLTVGSLNATSTTATTTFKGATSVGSSTPFSSCLFCVGTSTTIFGIDKNTGYIGINTVTPRANFHIAGPDLTDIHMMVGTDGAQRKVFDVHYDSLNEVGYLEAYHTGVSASDIWFRGKDMYFDSGQNYVPELKMLANGQVIVNDDAVSGVDFRAESVHQPNMLFVDSVNDRVGIASSSPMATLSVAGEIVANKIDATSSSATSTFSGNIAVSKNLEAQNYASTSILYLPNTSSATNGVLYLGGKRAFYNYVDPSRDGFNFFAGQLAGNLSVGSVGSVSTDGSRNAGLGYAALNGLTSGYNNTAVGYSAAYQATTGHENTAIGQLALQALLGGFNNTAVGSQALGEIAGSSNNTAIGYSAGYNGTGTGAGLQQTTFVGASTRSSTASISNSTAIGYQAVVSASNQIVIGNTNVTQTLLKGSVGIATTSTVARLAVQGGGSDVLNLFSSTGAPLLNFTNSGELGIGTTSPYAALSITTGDTTTAGLAISTTTGALIFSVDENSHVITGGGVPTISACGTSPSVTGGNDTNWRIKTGSGGTATTCTLTFAKAYLKAPICNVTQETGTAAVFKASTTPSTVVITSSAATLTSNFFTGHCEGY